MDIEPRRSGLGGAIGAMLVIALMCYLTYAALQGEHGLFRLFQIEAQEQRLKRVLAELQVESDALANKTQRLSAKGLDLDLLEERARAVLGFGRKDELLVR